MRAALYTLLVVAVLTAWLLALLVVVLALSQAAVEHAVLTPICAPEVTRC